MLTITIEVDDEARESAILSLLLGSEAPSPAKPAPKKAAKPEPEEDLLGTAGPTIADAVEKATEMVSSGGAAKVKEALSAVGAKRVSDISEEKVAEFLAALDA